MIIKTKDRILYLTEIQNINGSLDNNDTLKKQILQNIKKYANEYDYHKTMYGFVT